MKESMLASALIKACGISDKSEEAKSVRDWKRPGVEHIGDFPAVLEHVRGRNVAFMIVMCAVFVCSELWTGKWNVEID